jgi:hypothetical protein
MHVLYNSLFKKSFFQGIYPLNSVTSNTGVICATIILGCPLYGINPIPVAAGETLYPEMVLIADAKNGLYIYDSVQHITTPSFGILCQ